MSNYYTPPPEVKNLWQQNPDMSVSDALFFALNLGKHHAASH